MPAPRTRGPGDRGYPVASVDAKAYNVSLDAGTLRRHLELVEGHLRGDRRHIDDQRLRIARLDPMGCDAISSRDLLESLLPPLTHPRDDPAARYCTENAQRHRGIPGPAGDLGVRRGRGLSVHGGPNASP
jgi:hypothetical protein